MKPCCFAGSNGWPRFTSNPKPFTAFVTAASTEACAGQHTRLAERRRSPLAIRTTLLDMVPIFTNLVNPTQRYLDGTGRNKVCAAKRRQEVVQRLLIRQVQRAQLQASFELLFMKQVVGAHLCIKQVA
jgi:precorrin-6x reductase